MIYYSGFNGFGQWPEDNYVINNFTTLDLKSYGINNNITDKIDFHVKWAYNIVSINSNFILKGFVDGDPNRSELINLPIGETFTNVACSEKYVLFYNTLNKFVWKYCLDNSVEERWKRLPNFFDTEQCDTSKNEDSCKKIICGSMINIALSSEGRLFNIPSEIPVSHCIGKIVDISCGHEHGILLTDQGNVYTWGGGSRCQLGHGSTESLDTPELVDGLAGIKIVKISSGGWHNCALSSFGDLYTWGWNDRGQLGITSNVNIKSMENNDTDCDNTSNRKSTITSVNTEKSRKETCFNTAVPTYLDHNSDSIVNLKEKQRDDCDIEDSVKRKKLLSNNVSENIDTALISNAIPMLIDIYDSKCNALELNVVDVACGSKHTLIKLEDNSVWASGCNKYGQLGFHTDMSYTSSFKRVPIDIKDGRLHCGTWASLITSMPN